MTRLVGIAGGSGSGKSTLAYALKERYPDKIEVLPFDDYQKEEGEIPLLQGIPNWDHPESIDWEKLVQDLDTLQQGEDIELLSWTMRERPDHLNTDRVPLKIASKEIVILEGYLVLWNEEVRRRLHSSIFLDSAIEDSVKRRQKFTDTAYTNKVLIPMYHQFLLPTKKFANIIVDVSTHDAEQTLQETLSQLREKRIL